MTRPQMRSQIDLSHPDTGTYNLPSVTWNRLTKVPCQFSPRSQRIAADHVCRMPTAVVSLPPATDPLPDSIIAAAQEIANRRTAPHRSPRIASDAPLLQPTTYSQSFRPPSASRDRQLAPMSVMPAKPVVVLTHEKLSPRTPKTKRVVGDSLDRMIKRLEVELGELEKVEQRVKSTRDSPRCHPVSTNLVPERTAVDCRRSRLLLGYLGGKGHCSDVQ